MKSDHQLCICHGSSVASPSPLREAGRGLCVCLRVGRLMFAVNGALIGASRPGHPAPSCSTFQAASAFGSWPTFLLLAFTLSLPLSLSLFLSVSLLFRFLSLFLCLPLSVTICFSLFLALSLLLSLSFLLPLHPDRCDCV